MKLECAAYTHVGLVRSNNEDNFYLDGCCKRDLQQDCMIYSEEITGKKSTFFGVFDGMGGMEKGEWASFLAASLLDEYVGKGGDEDLMLRYVQEANELICETSRRECSEMGTTMAILHFSDMGEVVSYNIGDSRSYLCRNSEFFQLSYDHTEAQRMVELGIISKEDARSRSEKNSLTQYLGISNEEFFVEPYVSEKIQLQGEDVFLICSDGLSDMVESQEMVRLLNQREKVVHEIAEDLIECGLAQGSKDNITCVIIRVREERL